MSSDAHIVEVKLKRSHPGTEQAPAVERQAAQAVTSDIARRLTQWHINIARLRGLVEYRKSREFDAALSAEIEALAADIHEHRTVFIETVGSLPPHLASSGWITDIDRVLSSASEVIETMRATDVALFR